MCDVLPTTRPQWQKAINDLPSSPAKIPAFFFAHGQPMLVWPKAIAPSAGRFAEVYKTAGPDGELAQFLQDFGKALVEKYSPRAVVVFSAHWESSGRETLVTDYGEENPLLMDYYGFPPELYQIKFKSKGDSGVAQEVVAALKEAGIYARTTSISESRGMDGRNFRGPGLDHGVFVPFKHMFGDEMDIPVVQVSIDGSLNPAKEWALGKAVESLRSRQILILSGGLTYHNLQEFAFTESGARPVHKEFHKAILEALQVEEPEARQQAMYNLTNHAGFRPSHPREDHFVPIYVAAGAGEEGQVKILGAMYGIISVAFGL
ncbi:hypothetical protein FRB91_006321 [Serendipita sp. 411]|nr:hypothetical protein FRB91_006321 [Serendipita sp. 411]